METSVIGSNNSKDRKQKNLFALLLIPSVITNAVLSMLLAKSDLKIVMVPYFGQEMTVSNSGVSASYLEDTSILFLSKLLDLTSSNIGYKRDVVLRSTSNSNPKSLERLIEYFRDCERKYKKFGLSTFFSVKNLEIDLENLTVIAHGMLTSYYGKTGHESTNEDYRLEFEYQGGNLRLKSFMRIIDDEKIANDEARGLKFEENLGLEQNNNNSSSNLDIKNSALEEAGEKQEGDKQ